MKHLFIIHSHSNFLTAMSTISYLGLNSDDVSIAFFRNYKNVLFDNAYKSKDLTEMSRFNIFRHPIGFIKHIKDIDEEIGKLTNNEDYILYGPHPSLRTFEIIVSNPHCKGFNYLQEGALVLTGVLKEHELPFKYKLYDRILRLIYNNRQWSCYGTWRLPSFIKFDKEPECFAISTDVLGDSGYKQNIIKWPAYNIKGTQYEINPQWPCFIFESSIEQGYIEQEVYLHYCDILISEKGEEMNYVKFHPSQSEENKRNIEKFFAKNQKKYQELSMDFPFEVYMSTYKKMKIYGFKSSIVVLANNIGHKTYSLEDKLLASSEKYRKARLLLEKAH